MIIRVYKVLDIIMYRFREVFGALGLAAARRTFRRSTEVQFQSTR